ncbi:hypothetical protein NDN08_001906 [Rhodosorus marinus]|uniref:UEV domain-containing protein n=1 Tax=Rhodosorus marinus TaxID=101924 RepID=A0AAV8USA2_9RHOD|nr:hypothetical protein NDN08_001906 [Rhodosorus marinus]
MSGWNADPRSSQGSAFGQAGSLQKKVIQLLREAKIYPPQQERRIVGEVSSTIRQYPSLFPELAMYSLKTGKQVRLLRLMGTIPIRYMGSPYNIPISIWITEYFPNKCPLCYVEILEGMAVPRGHKHVDVRGMVYHPYLHRWQAQRDNIAALVFELCAMFSRAPPLFKKKRPLRADERKKLLVQQVTEEAAKRMNEPSARDKSTFHSRMEERARLEEVSQELLKELSNLNMENMSSVQRIETLKAENRSLEAWVEDNKEPKNVDSLLKAPSIPQQQLLNCLAKNRAYQDVLDALDDGISAEAISVGSYLKEIERIGRLQFFERAHQRRIKLYIAEQERTSDAT